MLAWAMPAKKYVTGRIQMQYLVSIFIKNVGFQLVAWCHLNYSLNKFQEAGTDHILSVEPLKICLAAKITPFSPQSYLQTQHSQQRAS